MTVWTLTGPGAGDLREVVAAARALRDLAPRLDATADALDASAGVLEGGWHGLAATSWVVQARALAGLVRALRAPVTTMAGSLDGYVTAVEDVARRANHASVDAGMTGAEVALRLAALGAVRAQADADAVAALGAAPRGLDQEVRRGAGASDESPPTRASGLLDGLGAPLARLAVRGMDDAELEALLDAAPHVAALLMSPTDLAADPRFAPVAAAARAAAGTGGGPEQVAAVAAALAGLTAADRAELVRLHPWFVGNLDGARLADRVSANRTALRAALHAVRRQERRLQAAGDQARALAKVRAEIARYDELLTGPRPGTGLVPPPTGHQVVLFDPAGARLAEIIGDLGPGTANLGVLVGGTGTNLANAVGQRTRAERLVRAGRGGLAVVTYQGGPMPQELTDAASSSYARDIAPRLRDFVAGVRGQTDAAITVAGHSYGGSVVGAAEAAGMVADRILHVASAGAGPGVTSPQDYAAPATPRYSLTAPGDPIAQVQGHELGPWGHGADPDELDGVVRLETGRLVHDDATSELLRGVSAHSDVFAPESTAWRNMLDVFTGGEVMLHTEPRLTAEVFTPGGYVRQYDLPMADPAFVPPTADVP